MTRVDPPRIVNFADLRAAAKRRLPRGVFDYIDGGTDAEWTLRENAKTQEERWGHTFDVSGPSNLLIQSNLPDGDFVPR